MVVDAEVNKEQRRPLFGVNGVVRSKKDLTGPTLLEMSGYPQHWLEVYSQGSENLGFFSGVGLSAAHEVVLLRSKFESNRSYQI